MQYNFSKTQSINYKSVSLKTHKTKQDEKNKINNITEGSTNMFYITSCVLYSYMDNSNRVYF